MSDVSYPRQKARTRSFQLGRPRSFTILPGDRLLFLRSASGTSPANDLWLFDGAERCIVSSAELTAAGEVPAAELSRRERMREVTEGITAFSVDDAGRFIVFTLSGHAYVTDLEDEMTSALPVPAGIVDPRISADGEHIAYVHERSLWRIKRTGSEPVLVAGPSAETESWGLTDFIAAEELDRMRGFWWLDDALLVERFDERDVRMQWIGDPAQPERPPVAHRYPAAGTANARVELWFITADGSRTEVERDHEAWPYVASVHDDHGIVIAYLSRDQRQMRIDHFDPPTQTSRTLRTVEDRHWVDVHPGVPTLDGDGALLTIEPVSGSNRLCRDGAPISPTSCDVVALLDADEPVTVLLQPEPTTLQLASIPPPAAPAAPQDHTTAWCVGVARFGNQVTACSNLDSTMTRFDFHTASGTHEIASHAERPILTTRPQIARVTDRALPTALLLPEHHDGGALPVIMSPYGGPHGQRVVGAASSYLTEQWIANRGYAVLVVDGAGTPGRGPDVERLVTGNLADPVLDDQVAALRAVAEQHRELDLDRVGIRGWSFGGYLAALAVLDRPDVFHAAVAGAPVTDWRLYDTAYTERYLGNPATDDAPYARTDLLTRAADLTRPLLLIHGLADDNVVAAHTLRLSQALLAAGREHQVLPLSGITHMTPQEIVAENLLLLEMNFFDTHLRRL